jgi:hypothetical protein
MESNCRKSIRLPVFSKLKVMSYEDITEVHVKGEAKKAPLVKGKRGLKRKSSAPVVPQTKRTRNSEIESFRVSNLSTRSWKLLHCVVGFAALR